MSKLTKLPRAEQWADRICAELGKTVESIIDVGRLLVKAKADLVHGEWLRMFDDGLVPFGARSAQMLMVIAEHPAITNTNHGSFLPPSWRTLYELTQVPAADLKSAFKDGLITPDMPRKAVMSLIRQPIKDARPPTPIPAGVFRLLYADPPWRYEHVETESRAIENQYPTMDLDAICALTVPAADDAVLYLWATSPKLAEAMRVIEAWHFTYRTCAVWDKEQIGMGYYFRQQHELLLVAARGALAVPDPSARPSSVIRSKRGAHSAKPAVVYDLLEAMYPAFTAQDRIELFTRTARACWPQWTQHPRYPLFALNRGYKTKNCPVPWATLWRDMQKVSESHFIGTLTLPTPFAVKDQLVFQWGIER